MCLRLAGRCWRSRGARELAGLRELRVRQGLRGPRERRGLQELLERRALPGLRGSTFAEFGMRLRIMG